MYSSVRIEDGVAIKRVKRADWAAAEAAYGQTIMALHDAHLYFIAPVEVCDVELRMPGGGIAISKIRLPMEGVKQILTALAHLHAAGIVHGDIHDGNILWDGQRARLIDFWRPNRGRLSAWSAPEEQWSGPHRSKQVDCYRLGLALTKHLGDHPLIDRLLDIDPTTRLTAQEASQLHELPILEVQ